MVLAVFAFFIFRSDGVLEEQVPPGNPEAVARPPASSLFVDFPIYPGQIYIPSIKVNSSVLAMPTHMEANPFIDGRVVPSFGVPPDLAQTAWWSDGPQPGAAGMAVITGHTSGGEQYAVFNDLPKVKAGDDVIIETKQGDQRIKFRIISTVTGIPKSDATALQEALTNHPENARLALITCSGDFDGSVGASVENSIAFAEIVPAAEANGTRL